MARCGRCPCKLFVWFVWGLHIILCIVYAAMSLYTYHNFDRIMGKVKSEDARDISAFKHGILASLLLGFLLVLLWIIASFFIMLGRYFADISMIYGVMIGWGIGTAMFQLLAGLVVQNARPIADQAKEVGVWSDRDHQSYYACFAFSYILIVSFLFTSMVLWFGCHAMRKEGSGSDSSSKYGPQMHTNQMAGTQFGQQV